MPKKPPFRVIGRNGEPSRIPPSDYLLHAAQAFEPSQEAIARWEFEWACHGLLPAHQITMLCAPANLGKSSVAFYMLEQAAKTRGKFCYYWHADSSPGDAKTFGVRAHEAPNVFYMMPDFGGNASTDEMRNYLAGLFAALQEEQLAEGSLADHVFCFDSLGNFVEDVNSKVEVKMFFADLKRLRGAGATVLLLHHPTKQKVEDQWQFDGVNNIRTELDGLIYLDPGEERGGGKWHDLTVRVDKKRASYAEKFLEKITLDRAERTVAVEADRLLMEQVRMVDFLQAELAGVMYLTRAQAMELLREKGQGRNEGRRLIDAGLERGKWFEERATGSPEKRLFHPDAI